MSALSTMTTSMFAGRLQRVLPPRQIVHRQAGDTQELCRRHFQGTEDDFRQANQRVDGRFWTGHTWFETVKAALLPPEFAARAKTIAHSAAHDFYVFQEQQAALTVEYLLAFPSHRIFGGDGRSRRSTAATSTDEGQDGNDFDDEEDGEEETFAEDQVKQELRDLQVQPPSAAINDPIVPPDMRRELYRVHRNLGHPDQQSFCRALKHAGVKAHILKWVKKEFVCPICESRKRPASHRPAHLSKAMGFNEVVGIDLMFYKKKVLVNMLDWGTNYQIVEWIPDKTSDEVTQAFMSSWVAHYGSPHLVVCDQGTELTGRPFATTLNEAGVMIHYTDVRSPWQNSRTKRLVESSSHAWKKFATKSPPWMRRTSAWPSLRRRGLTTCITTGRDTLHAKGCSGLPRSLLSDDYLDKEFMNEPESDYLKMSERIREAARKAWMEVQDLEAVSRAARSNTRMTDVKPLTIGEVVYVWRDTPDFKGWVGPGLLVAESENGRSLWISVRGYLVKASREQVRRATSEESLGAELAQVLSATLLEDLENGRVKNYKDVTDEGIPLTDLSNAEESDLGPDQEEKGNAVIQTEAPLPTITEEDEDMGVEKVNNPRRLPQPEEMENDGSESTRAPFASEMDPTPRPSTLPSRSPSMIRVDEASSGSFLFGPTAPSRSEPSRPAPYPFSNNTPSWPRPTMITVFMQVANFDNEEADGARWWNNKI